MEHVLLTALFCQCLCLLLGQLKLAMCSFKLNADSDLLSRAVFLILFNTKLHLRGAKKSRASDAGKSRLLTNFMVIFSSSDPLLSASVILTQCKRRL